MSTLASWLMMLGAVSGIQRAEAAPIEPLTAVAGVGAWYQWWSVVTDTNEHEFEGAANPQDDEVTLAPGLGQQFVLGGRAGPVRLATRWLRSNRTDEQVEDLQRARRLGVLVGYAPGEKGEIQVVVDQIQLPGLHVSGPARRQFAHLGRTIQLRWLAQPGLGDGFYDGWYIGLRSERTETVQNVHVAETGVFDHTYTADAVVKSVAPVVGFSFVDRLTTQERSFVGPFGEGAFAFPGIGMSEFDAVDESEYNETIAISILMEMDAGVTAYWHNDRWGGGPYIRLGARGRFLYTGSFVTEDEDDQVVEGTDLVFGRTDMRGGPFVDVGVSF